MDGGHPVAVILGSEGLGATNSMTATYIIPLGDLPPLAEARPSWARAGRGHYTLLALHLGGISGIPLPLSFPKLCSLLSVLCPTNTKAVGRVPHCKNQDSPTLNRGGIGALCPCRLPGPTRSEGPAPKRNTRFKSSFELLPFGTSALSHGVHPMVWRGEVLLTWRTATMALVTPSPDL